jgi:integrase
MRGKLLSEAVAKKAISRRFTFHDLRARYATQHREQDRSVPDPHAFQSATARVYERSVASQLKAL